MNEIHLFSRKEELANAITHAIGIVLSIVALSVLITFASLHTSPLHVISVTIYGTTMLLLYLSSTLLHSFKEGKAKDMFEKFDHAAIYLFIAGTYTPFLFHVIESPLSWILFGIVWSFAFLGVIFKVFFVKRFKFASTLMYVLMGWMIVFAWDQLQAALPTSGLFFLVGGGLLYTVGTIFFLWRHFPYHHAVWHVFVLAGSLFHFFAVYWYVLPLS